jgi:hypothetical protein
MKGKSKSSWEWRRGADNKDMCEEPGCQMLSSSMTDRRSRDSLKPVDDDEVSVEDGAKSCMRVVAGWKGLIG